MKISFVFLRKRSEIPRDFPGLKGNILFFSFSFLALSLSVFLPFTIRFHFSASARTSS